MSTRLRPALRAPLLLLLLLGQPAQASEGLDPFGKEPAVCSGHAWGLNVLDRSNPTDGSLDDVWHTICTTGRWRWNEERVMSECEINSKLPSYFINDILKKSPYKERLAETGLAIYGVELYGDLNLDNGTVPGNIKFECVNLNDDAFSFNSAGVSISFKSATVQGSLSFVRVKADKLSFTGATIKGQLELDGVNTHELNAVESSTDGDIAISDSTIGIAS
jgi:hypothetical protein